MKKFMFALWAIIVTSLKAVFNFNLSPALALGLSHNMAKMVNSIAGITYYTSGKGGIGMRARVPVANPNTGRQQTERARMSTSATGYRGLAATVRLGLNALAATLNRVNGLGLSYKPTGFQLWMELNRNLQTIGLPILTSVPAIDTVESFTSMSVVADTTLGTMAVTFAGPIPATQRYVLSATPGMSPGINNPKGKFKVIKILDVGDLTPFDAWAAYVYVYGGGPAVGTIVYLQARPVSVSSGIGGAIASCSDIAV